VPDFTLGEILLVAVLAVFILGPDRMPEYAAKLAHWIRKLRVMAEGAKTQLKDQLGPDYQDINWRQYDPRQYDPRKIVREALLDPIDESIAPVRESYDSLLGRESSPVVDAEPESAVQPSASTVRHSASDLGRASFDTARPVPYDVEAT
jgi:sec-independent protein translocase protein TatB